MPNIWQHCPLLRPADLAPSNNECKRKCALTVVNVLNLSSNRTNELEACLSCTNGTNPGHGGDAEAAEDVDGDLVFDGGYHYVCKYGVQAEDTASGDRAQEWCDDLIITWQMQLSTALDVTLERIPLGNITTTAEVLACSFCCSQHSACLRAVLVCILVQAQVKLGHCTPLGTLGAGDDVC